MVTGREAFIILGVIACMIAVFGAICWLAYAAYIGRGRDGGRHHR